jgi:hypothetical protein
MLKHNLPENAAARAAQPLPLLDSSATGSRREKVRRFWGIACLWRLFLRATDVLSNRNQPPISMFDERPRWALFRVARR